MKDGDCDVCEGLCRYPIHNRKGREVLWIVCPVCHGTGSEGEADEDAAVMQFREAKPNAGIA